MADRDEAEPDFCYVTTTGRRSGGLHTIEIWFARDGDTLYLLSGGGDASDWVKNILVNPTVGVRLGERDMICRARLDLEPDEEERARRLVVEKYARAADDLSGWGRTALPVAIDLPRAPEPA